MEEKDIINDLLNIIFKATNSNIANEIFSFYSKNKKDDKPIYNLFGDAFLSIHAYCGLIFEHCWSQAFTILRMALEQVSTLTILSLYPDLVSEYLSLHKLKCDYYSVEENEEKRINFINEHNLPKNKIQLKRYFDYSWVSKITKSTKNDLNDLIQIANLGAFKGNLDTILSASAHGQLPIFQLSGPDGKWGVMKKVGLAESKACCKLFHFLCAAYADYTSVSELEIATDGLCNDFAELWLKFLK